ncbi:hypothetical protein Tco_1561297, partial [Tanacetum coccineum]
MGSNEETNAAGTDTRPPMLVESDYDSWKIRIHRYIRGKPNGKLIWKSIQNGPTPHPMITDPPPTDSTIVPAPRKKLDSEFSEEENKLEMADTQAEIILSQDLYASQSLLASMPKDSQETSASTSIVDPLAYVAHTTTAPIANLLSGFQKQFPPTNNQLRTSSNSRTHATVHDGHIVTEPVQRKAPGNNGNTDTRSKKVICYHCRGARPVASKRKEKSIAFLQSEKEKILSEKKDLADSYLDEIVCLKTANKVARDMLQRFNMPTQTIPMLSKKPKKATADLHKDILGTRNPGLGYMAKRAQPVLYDADTLLHPNHHPVSIWDSEEFVEQQLVPFYDHFKKHIQAANDTFFKEIKEFEQIFDELEAEYEQCVLDNKNLTIEKKNLL